MANLTDKTYFKNDRTLPKGELDNLPSEIKRYEPEILDKLFGYELSKEIQEYDKDDSDQRIKDIVEGKEYTISYNGRDPLIKWNGLVNDDKISLITDYVYYWHMRNNASQTANVGEVIPDQQHSNVASANQKAVSAWYDMRQLYGYCGQPELKPSAFNFLTEFESVYPEWVFEEIGSINIFGL